MPITKFCDQKHLTPRERLELFVPVGQALQHAHQKGIIHRDIKPSNVLVAKYGDQAVPKIIDFGIVKAIEQQLTEKTMFTQFGQILGTIDYMSPEQAELNQFDVDTRSDIYSLGVLLYELLTGETPFDRKRLRSAAFDEMLRIIREEEPPKPSLRLTASESLPSVAPNRQIEPKKLSTFVRGELDWIVMKALDKDRSRRYETANGLAADIERYLKDEPVVACPPSTAYRFRKFARRNKAPLSAAVVVVLTLIVGIVGTSWQAIRATEAERIAQDDRDRALDAEQLAQERLMRALTAEGKVEAEARQARTEAAKANAVVELLGEMLASANPNAAKGTDFTVRELLDEFSAGLEGQLQDQPEVEATLRQIIGAVYTRLHLPDEAEPHLRRALELRREIFGPDHVQVVETLCKLAQNTKVKKGRLREVERLAREALEIYRKRSDASGMIDALWIVQQSLASQRKYSELEDTAAEALALARKFDLHDHQELPNIHHNLAAIKSKEGDYAAGERLAREALEKHLRIHGENHPETGWGWLSLGQALKGQERFGEAEDCFRKALGIFQEQLPQGHWFLSWAYNNLIDVLKAQGDEPGLDLINQAKLAETTSRIEDNPDDSDAYRERGQVYLKQEKYEQAIADLSRALEIRRRMLGDETRNTLKSMGDLANVYKDQGRYDEAEELRREQLEIRRRTLGDENSNTLWSMHDLAIVYKDQDRHDEAEELHQQTLEIRRRTLGNEHSSTLWSIRCLTNVYFDQGRWAEAEKLHRQMLEIRRRTRGDEHPSTLWNMTRLAKAHQYQGHYDEAEELHHEALEIRRRTLGDEHPDTLRSIGALAELYFRQGRYDEAKGLVRELWETCQESNLTNSPNAHWLNTVAWLLTTSPYPELHDAERALRFAEKAAEIKPNSWSIANTLGVAHYRAGNWNAAVETLTTSMELAQGANLGLDAFFLAMAHWQLDEKEKARDWYDKAAIWMDEKKSKSKELVRFRAEAEELLGVEVSTVPAEPKLANAEEELPDKGEVE